MKQHRKFFVAIGIIGLVCSVLLLLADGSGGSTVQAATDGPSAYRSPFDLAYSPDGKHLAVSDRTATMLYLLDAESGDVRQTVPLQGTPMDLTWSTNDAVLVCEYDAGTVARVDVGKGSVSRRIAVGPKCVGIAVAPRKGLLVASDFGLHTVSLIDLANGQERAKVPVARHPYFVAVTPDERLALTAALIPEGPATDPASASIITLIDLKTRRKTAEIMLPDSSSNARQIAVSPDSRWAYVVHTRGRTMLPTTQLDRGWVNTNAMSIIDLKAKELYATVLLDTVTEGAADPWGIALSDDGRTAWISVAGVHQIARIELGKLHEFCEGGADVKDLGLHDTYSGAAAVWQAIREDPNERKQLSYHLSALYAADLMERINIPAKCPRGIDLSPTGDRLAVASYYTGEVLLLDPEKCRLKETIALGCQPEVDEVRHGEFVFHNGRHSFQHWLSCSTCHAGGRVDGMNWDLLNDGIGNPKNARSLLWSHKTPPVMSLGVRESMDEAALKGFQFIQFRQVEENDLEAVRTYLRSLKPERSPHLVDGRLSRKAIEGKRLFEDAEVGCAHCHPGPLFTSLEAHNVGTRHELDRKSAFDTPTCVELWRTGPYLHDGSAVTLKEVLTTMNPDDRHGKTSHLSPEQIDALIAYLLSL